MVTRLPDDAVAGLRAAPLTYADVGATMGAAPPSYRTFTRTRLLEHASFEQAAEALMTWQVHERAGLHVAASGPRVGQDAVVVMRLGPRVGGIRIPCRVVHVIDEPDATGFAYGTLPGHPESGEERFEVRRRSDGGAAITVAAFSRPATLLARAGGPLTRAVQARMTQRYLRAADLMSPG